MERRQGIISVFDKEGIVEFCKSVSSHFDFISTGKTAKLLETSNVPVTRVSDFTGYPEILGGRIKTLHPKIMGGILGTTEQKSEIEKMDLQPIGLVVSNLYPFEQVISKKHDFMDAIENIDIGGVTLLRAAAKNYHEVLVVSSPSDYERVASAISEDNISDELRKELAVKAFHHTAKYDIAISQYLSSDIKWPPSFVMGFQNPQDLRYGENWHQEAKYYLTPGSESFYKQIHGKKVSYNNLVDFTSAIGVLSEFDNPTCAIIKHTSPCGVAIAKEVEAAFDDAFATDNLSAFGSVMGFNRNITEPLAKKLNAMFVDAIIAPQYNPKGLEILTKKKNLILCTFNDIQIPELAIRLVPSGILVQPADTHKISNSDLKVVSKRSPSKEELAELMFAWKIVKYAKSNAAVISTGTRTLGVGMGQTSRVGAVELALKKAGEHTEGSVMASDAFFPYRDSIDTAVKEGVSAVIAPGGSIRDNQSITAADEAGISLVWSGIRAFLH
ncbi:MAG: bifunctional phosphoribosylaminoimidazolecarboxamide formyltransferase/IMP cyclohydrolase [Candidatus Thorarchaeota archaeon]